MFLPTKNTPRWIIFLIDIVLITIAYALSFLIRFEFNPPADEIDGGLSFFWYFLVIRATGFLIGNTFSGIIRHTSVQDSKRIFFVLLGGTVLFLALNFFKINFVDGMDFIPFSIILIEFLLSLFAMVVSRIAVKLLYLELKTPSRSKINAVIYGAGEAGLIAKRTFEQDAGAKTNVIAFLDDDKRKAGKKLEGASIFHTTKAQELFGSGKVDEIIISIQNLSRERKRNMVQAALRNFVRVRSVPPVKSWINGELSINQIKNIRIDDLLGRESISLDSQEVLNQLRGKVVLVTGGSGSIGSELVRQITNYDPKKIIVFDQAESPLYELQQELDRKGSGGLCEFVIGDVRQEERIRRLFDFFKPQIVFHAAAYKHVPLMEENPSEAILTNVMGTQIVADLSDEFSIERFVMISTDKAVNPTNVMGASKRVAEIYVQSKNKTSKTAYITTRFGNVLGSTGSVIPLFKKQIEEGGPITVTDKEVTRFFMTIPEAVQLVLEAGSMGSGGEIFVFDMGESVKILDLARNMIQLAGLEEGKDIQIEFTGLRPGEKLYEELLNNEENTLPTHHNKILKAKVREYEFEVVRSEIKTLVDLFNSQDNASIVKMLKKLVPEYVSENSVYSELDK